MRPTVPLTRREALAAGAVAVAGALTPLSALAAPENMKDAPWIDAHSHIWPADVDKYPLVNGQTKADLNPSSFTDGELMAIAHPEGVGRVVLIQHSVYHLFDNSYLVDAVHRHPYRFRVVGMVDDQQPEAGAKMHGLLKQGVTGFRITPFIRKDNPSEWLDNPGMREMWQTGAETGQAMCCLIGADDLPRLHQMCVDHPETPVVIDHFARIGFDGEIRDVEVAQLCDLSKHKHVSVKLSAYYALGQKKPPHLELVPMIKRLLDSYGPERLMWASDCPYQIQGENNYKASISLIRDQLGGLSAGDKEWLLRKTAERVFFFV